MKLMRLLSLLLLAAVVGYTPALVVAQVSPHAKGVKPGVIEATPLNEAGTYCHLRFPAIQPRTLGTAKPELKTSKSGDIVDMYGPCDYDPVGYDEVCRQKAQSAKNRMCD